MTGGPTRPRHTGWPSLVAGQFRYANQGFWRTPVAAFFTLAFPLIFLVSISLLVGDQTTGPDGGVRVTQFLTPVAVVFSAVMASYATLAMATATQREQGVLKRLRGTPLPTWAYVAGRIASAVWIAALGTVIMLAVGVLAYDVQIIARTVPALLVTMVLGVSTFAALGLAVVALLRTSAAVSAVTIGTVVLLGFVSDMFTGPVEMPGWLEITGWIFPLKHFANAMSDVFNPFHPGSGFEWDNLAVLAAWGVAGATVALRFFTWDPKGRAGRSARVDRATTHEATRALRPVVVHPPTPWRLFAAQTGYAARTLARDLGSTFFAVLFPIALLILMLTLYGDVVVGGQALGPVMTAGMAVYAVAVTAYVNLPESTATARDRGILKRLSGTPLPAWAYLAGRLMAAMVIGFATAGVMLVVASTAFGVSIPARAIPALVVVAVVGVVMFAALGLAVAALAPSAKAVPAVTLGTLLPLSFISDVFVFGAPAPVMAQRIAWFFPLKHFSAATAEGLAGTMAWEHLAVMLLWGLLGGVFAMRLFRWSPRRRRPASTTPSAPRGEVHPV